MAGCTDLAFRLIAREYGMEFAFLEMVSAKALVYSASKKTLALLKKTEEDRPLGAQLMGCDPDIMGEAAGTIEDMGFDLLDLNLGCPAPKVTGSGGGSALLLEPETAKQIFQKVVKNIKRIPVTVKMRKGFSDPSGDEAVRIAKIAEDCGLSAVTVHGRTRVQGYSGSADWEAIGRVKQAIRIPVFGNGDVLGGEHAKKLLEVSGCDGIMIGRAALGNPWIYKSVAAVLEGGEERGKPTFEEHKEAALKHLSLEIETEGEWIGCLKSRRIMCWYFKDYPGINAFRDRINRSTSPSEIRKIVEDFAPNIDPSLRAAMSLQAVAVPVGQASIVL
jgi:nifR3 family TIM-barrel protein